MLIAPSPVRTMLALRSAPSFAVAANVNVDVPVLWMGPEAPTKLSQVGSGSVGALRAIVAVHWHPSLDGVTVTLLTLAPEGSDGGCVELTVYVQPDACVIATDWPPTLMVPCRSEPV